MNESNTGDDSYNSQEREGRNESSSTQEEPRLQGMDALKAYAVGHKIDMALWLTRALTLLFCISYILPIFR